MHYTTTDQLINAVVDDYNGRTAYAPNELRLALARFVPWAHRVVGTELDPATMFTRRNIERFAQTGLDDYTPASRKNIRSRLLRLQELIDPDARHPRLQPMTAAPVLAPYSLKEIAALSSWAATQRTPLRRQSALVLLALGLGAGMSAAEIGEARSRDVVLDSGFTLVNVRGRRARKVPLLAEWAKGLMGIAVDIDDDDYLFRPGRTRSWPNVITSFVGPSTHELRPQSQRLRSTWMVLQLIAGTNVRALVEAAGIDSLEALTRHLEYVSMPTEGVTRSQLASALSLGSAALIVETAKCSPTGL